MRSKTFILFLLASIGFLETTSSDWGGYQSVSTSEVSDDRVITSDDVDVACRQALKKEADVRFLCNSGCAIGASVFGFVGTSMLMSGILGSSPVLEFAGLGLTTFSAGVFVVSFCSGSVDVLRSHQNRTEGHPSLLLALISTGQSDEV